MNNDKDRNQQAGQNNDRSATQNHQDRNAQQQAGQNDDRQNQNRPGGGAQQQAGQPGTDRSAEIQARQNEHLHRDATKEMHDQLGGTTGDRNQQQAGKDPGNARNQQGDAGKDANRGDANRNAGQQQAGQRFGNDDARTSQGKDANRSGQGREPGNQQK